MKSDIKFLKVEDIGIAVVPDMSDEGISIFSTYLINYKLQPIHTVLIRSKGIGKIEQREVKTATLRKLIEIVDAQSFVKIDSFETAAGAIHNEYWISFSFQNYLYDKKFVFVPGSIEEENFIQVPVLNKKGVLIR